jgi:hypothetical protein
MPRGLLKIKMAAELAGYPSALSSHHTQFRENCGMVCEDGSAYLWRHANKTSGTVICKPIS